jgi:CheY-like chemotaxis protein
MSAANILNGVNTGSAFGINNETSARFIAPSAKILIVDDIQTNLKVAEGLLLPYKMQVDLCSSGRDAIEAARNKNYDLIFMDHMMPEMDGIEATAAIRAWENDQENGINQRKQIPIIALTANVISGMREIFIRKGFNDLFAKPIDISKLDEILARWIPKEKRESKTPNEVLDNNVENLPPVDVYQLHIPAVDISRGIAMTGGTVAGYYQVLSMFYKDVEDRLPLLQAAPDTDALSMFITQVHSLKSASASIGATELSKEAAVLEASGRAGDLAFIEKNLNSFVEHLVEMVDGIRSVLESEKTESQEYSISVSEHLPLLHELAAALQSQKAGSIDRILEELKQNPLDSKTKEALEKISDQVLMTEFDSALKIVEELFTAINYKDTNEGETQRYKNG